MPDEKNCEPNNGVSVYTTMIIFVVIWKFHHDHDHDRDKYDDGDFDILSSKLNSRNKIRKKRIRHSNVGKKGEKIC